MTPEPSETEKCPKCGAEARRSQYQPPNFFCDKCAALFSIPEAAADKEAEGDLSTCPHCKKSYGLHDFGCAFWLGEALPNFAPHYESLRAQVAQLTGELNSAMIEALRLATSIHRSEYKDEAPDWQPLDTAAGVISQIDNMYAGIRAQRDKAVADLAAARKSIGKIKELAERIAARPRTYQNGHLSQQWADEILALCDGASKEASISASSASS